MQRSKVVPQSSFIPNKLVEKDLNTHPWLKLYLLHPESKCRVVWDLLCLWLILYDATIVPFVLGFSVEMSGSLGYLEFCTTVFFLLDICRL
jgi:hypothetical protein